MREESIIIIIKICYEAEQKYLTEILESNNKLASSSSSEKVFRKATFPPIQPI